MNSTGSNKGLIIGVGIVAVVVLAAVFGKKEHLDNPLVFLIMLTVFVSAGQKVGQWAGVRANSPGIASFFGTAN